MGFVSRNSSMKKRLIIISVIVFAFVFGALLLVISLHINPLPQKNINKYDIKNTFKGSGTLVIFPDRVDEKDCINYYYWERKGIFDTDYQIYLACKYNSATFESEVNRLKDIKCTYKSEEHTIKYNTEDYNFDAYETINNWDRGYEYALIDEAEHIIYYVHLEFINKDRVVFDHSLLPDNYAEHDMDFIDGYNMYAYKISESMYHVVE